MPSGFSPGFSSGFGAGASLPALNFNESAAFTALRSFLLGLNLTTSGTGAFAIQQGQANRVVEPPGPDFIVFWPLSRLRFATNQNVYGDCAFTGQVTANVLTVSNIQFGIIGLGALLYGSGVPTGTSILGQLSGSASGTVGTYLLSSSFTAGSGLMAAGVMYAMQEAQLDVQLDVHGPNSHDNTMIITTLFRDEYAVDQFATSGSAPLGFPSPKIPGTTPWQLNVSGYTAIAPIDADDPKQVPFQNAEQQWENRWVITARLQVNQIVTIGQQFFSQIQVIKEAPADLT